MTVDRVQRRMATILAADAVGYSRLIGRDEEGDACDPAGRIVRSSTG